MHTKIENNKQAQIIENEQKDLEIYREKLQIESKESEKAFTC